jgi:hypothetical protein
VTLIYGEDLSDADALAELVSALKPVLTTSLETRRLPLVLVRGATVDELRRRADRIAGLVEGERARHDVVNVVVHEDCDEVEPAHVRVALEIEVRMAAAGCPVCAVAIAWEIESWWFQWPEAVQALNGSWRLPDDYVQRDVGRIRNAKEELNRCLRRGLGARARARVRQFRGSDSPAVAANVRVRGEADAPRARSHSYDVFRAKVAASAF